MAGGKIHREWDGEVAVATDESRDGWIDGVLGNGRGGELERERGIDGGDLRSNEEVVCFVALGEFTK